MSKRKKSPPIDWIGKDIRASSNIRFYKRYTSAPGCLTLELLHIGLPCPVGFIWYRTILHYEAADILWIQTLPAWRLCGVGRRLIESLVSEYETIYTDACVDATAEAFAKTMGFVKERKHWVLKRKA